MTAALTDITAQRNDPPKRLKRLTRLTHSGSVSPC
jgi:hypothetical protein